MQQLIVIEGATASGKTALAARTAKKLETVVISSDSRQCYKELAIGTAKPTVEEMLGIPHYFVDSHSITAPLTSAAFADQAMELLQTTLSKLPFVVVTGGSGMFTDALCIGLDPIPTDAATALELRLALERHGTAPLLRELRERDPVFAAEADTSNPPRILRALEVIRFTGKPFSEWRKRQPLPRPFGVQRFIIDHPRELLYERINYRVDLMIAAGLEKEARDMMQYRHLSPLQTVGYKEWFDHFDGLIDRTTCISLIKQHTRNYAKRQLTWFRKHPERIHIPYSDPDTMLSKIIQEIE